MIPMTPLRISTPEETPLQASKWLQCPALLDGDEMEQLLNNLNPFSFFLCGAVCKMDQEPLSKNEFLKHYTAYIKTLKNGQLPDPQTYRPWFSPIMTVSTDSLYAIPLSNNQQLLRISKPVIQLQSHNIDFSLLDKKFRSMVFGSDSIPWGIQFSYPQIFQGNDLIVEQTKNSANCPNTALFQQLQKWIRNNTIPTPFEVEGIRYNAPMRLGKKCLSWINCHPQLVKKGISVKGK